MRMHFSKKRVDTTLFQAGAHDVSIDHGSKAAKEVHDVRARCQTRRAIFKESRCYVASNYVDSEQSNE